MKTPIVVEVETRDGDPDRCGRDCQFLHASCGEVPGWCLAYQDFLYNGLRCPACLDGETKANGGKR